MLLNVTEEKYKNIKYKMHGAGESSSFGSVPIQRDVVASNDVTQVNQPEP